MKYMSEKIKILYLSSSPSDQLKLEVDREFREIYQTFSQNSATRDNFLRKDGEFRAVYENARDEYFRVISVSNLQSADIQAVILKNSPEIIHFSGHASADEIFFEDVEGISKGVSKNALVNFLKILPRKPTLIFFNACQTAEILKSLVRFIDFVVVTRQEVDDEVAVTFAAKFYESLSLGQTVKTAFELAKNHFEIDGQGDAAKMYKLFIREGTDENRILFRLAAKKNGETSNSKKDTKKQKKSTVTNNINVTGKNRIKDFKPIQANNIKTIKYK